ncbi:MAG: DNA repair protein RadC [Anaerolineales bacterium]|nr:DNA repair protein RadC [Anaerolineales bacterium]
MENNQINTLPGFDPEGPPRQQQLVRALPVKERPTYRATYCAEACTTTELLAAVIRGPDQIEVATDLTARFGDVHGVAAANDIELKETLGIGAARAGSLKAAFELGRRLNQPPPSSRPIQSPEEAASILMPRMQHLEREELVVLLLNTRNQPIGEPIVVYRGSLNSSLIRIGEVLRPAVRSNAAAIIVAHNHPSADPTPSPEDVAVTRAIVESGELLDICVLDHLIIGHGRYVSLKSKGLGF